MVKSVLLFTKPDSMNLIENIDIKKPIVKDPESPINIFAGAKLKNKKPNKAPANAKLNEAQPKSPVK